MVLLTVIFPIIFGCLVAYCFKRGHKKTLVGLLVFGVLYTLGAFKLTTQDKATQSMRSRQDALTFDRHQTTEKPELYTAKPFEDRMVERRERLRNDSEALFDRIYEESEQ